MPTFSQRSLARLDSCDISIQAIFYKLVEDYDCSIICGYRNAQDQNVAFEAGNSKVQWPDSNHNDYPSKAIDVTPYPQMWDSKDAFYFMAGRVQQIADELGIKIRWGGNWDMDNDLNDQTFMDFNHWELVD